LLKLDKSFCRLGEVFIKIVHICLLQNDSETKYAATPLKGIYDYHESHSILITGSARFELYGRGGDSLQGRYYLHRLYPFTLSEQQAGLFRTIR
jgi:hypothetical protein